MHCYSWAAAKKCQYESSSLWVEKTLDDILGIGVKMANELLLKDYTERRWRLSPKWNWIPVGIKTKSK